MSGADREGLLQDQADQGAAVSKLQQAFEAKKQGWRKAWLDSFQRLLQSPAELASALSTHQGVHKNGEVWAPDSADALNAGLSALTAARNSNNDGNTFDELLTNPDAGMGINEAHLSDGWKVAFPIRTCSSLTAAVDTSDGRGFGLPSSIAAVIKGSNVLAYDAARSHVGCSIDLTMNPDVSVREWRRLAYQLYEDAVNDNNGAVPGAEFQVEMDSVNDYLQACQHAFDAEVYQAMQDLIFYDLYEQAAAFALLDNRLLPDAGCFQISGGQALIDALEAMKNSSHNQGQRIEYKTPRLTPYEFAAKNLEWTLDRQDFTALQCMVKPFAKSSRISIEKENERLRLKTEQISAEEAEERKAKLTVALKAVNKAITTPSVKNAKEWITATQGFSHYTPAQKRRWAVCCVILLSIIAVGIIVGVAMTGAVPALAALAPIEEALIAGCVTAGISGGVAVAPVAKAAHVALSKHTIKKTAEKAAAVIETQFIAGG